ncbi:hypothetical protein I310_03972 [Cryptococcus deuterogattii CA1014]|nr:hypothetical protein I310_03972 [Cryptococcus deuterogattii CA1014]
MLARTLRSEDRAILDQSSPIPTSPSPHRQLPLNVAPGKGVYSPRRHSKSGSNGMLPALIVKRKQISPQRKEESIQLLDPRYFLVLDPVLTVPDAAQRRAYFVDLESHRNARELQLLYTGVEYSARVPISIITWSSFVTEHKHVCPGDCPHSKQTLRSVSIFQS